ncbi:serine protease [uncultured Roseovarius sp.]|uniref:trypsin-like serine peptidase n=1 Tax=uncultured Roseovarius sp. TaxID=293344 RepID=UPI00261B557D|nr:serine protease [uncultured Roseovarius sp.]
MAISALDLGISDIKDSLKRARSRVSKFKKAKQMIAKRMGHHVESEERRELAQQREEEMANQQDAADSVTTYNKDLGKEAYIGPRNNILSGEFLEIGLLTARSVCKITHGLTTGTGFLVGDGVVLTNYHVLSKQAQASAALFEFLYEDNTIGTPRNSQLYMADPERFFVADEALDLCFVALREGPGSIALSDLGWLPLIRREGKILIGDPINIIQHPLGDQQRVVMHESTFILVENGTDADAFCWYSGDTAKGSSGAPVFNTHWEVVALHHQAIPATDKNGNVLDVNGKAIAESRLEEEDTLINWIANEGTRASRIVKFLEKVDLPDDQDQIRQSLLKLWQGPLATRNARLAALHGVENST